MVCPECGGELRGIDSVYNTKENEVLRRKRCTKCGRLVVTVEFEIERNEQFQRDWNEYKNRGKKEEDK